MPSWAGSVTGISSMGMDRSRSGRASQSAYGEGVRNPRARQRAMLIAAGPEEPDLAELRELLRTAGVAVAGELTQRRAAPRPRPPFRQGQPPGAQAGTQGGKAPPNCLAPTGPPP